MVIIIIIIMLASHTPPQLETAFVLTVLYETDRPALITTRTRGSAKNGTTRVALPRRGNL